MNSNYINIHDYCSNNINLHIYRLVDVGSFLAQICKFEIFFYYIHTDMSAQYNRTQWNDSCC